MKIAVQTPGTIPAVITPPALSKISGDGYSDETETNEDGDYVLEVPAGSYTITFEADGYDTQSIKVTVKADDWYEMDTVVMSPAGTGVARIYGYVYDTNGNEMNNVKITAKNITTKRAWKDTTDGDGFFEIEDLEAGRYKIVAKKNKYKNAKETVTLKAGQEEYVEFNMRKKGKKGNMTIAPEEGMEEIDDI